MLEFIESLPAWAIKTLALLLGLAGAALGGLLFALLLGKVRRRMPPPED